MKHGRETLKLRDIMAIAMIDNVASQRVLEKLGFEVVKQTMYDGHRVLIYRESPG